MGVSEAAAAAEAARLVQETTSLLIYHHSSSVFFLGQIEVQPLGMKPNPRLLNLAATFRTTGRVSPFSDADQRLEVATTHLGVLTDAVGFGLDRLHTDQVTETLAVHPRGDLKNAFLSAYFDGYETRPETTNGAVNSDVLDHFIPGFRRTTIVERRIGSPRPCGPEQASGTAR
nr:diguanylate cyclase [Rhodococcus wratislaviensis]